MNGFFYLVALLVVGAAVFFAIKDKLDIFLGPVSKYPFVKKDFLMNVPERKFFEELKKIIPTNYVVFPQVVLGSIIKPSVSGKERIAYRNKINRKTIDFVLFELPYYRPVLCLEYDGKTHERSDRMERDLEVEKMLESAGIKSFHVKHEENINFVEVKTKIVELLSPRPA